MTKLALTRWLLTSLATLALAGCSIYKSSDREDFNAHGKERAPVAAKPVAQDECLVAGDLPVDAEVLTTSDGDIAKFTDGSLHAVCTPP